VSLIVKTPPTVEPIGLDEAKAHLRVGIADDDQVIENAIRAARWNLEDKYRIACMTQSLVLGLDYFVQADYDPYSPVWPIWPAGWWLATSWWPRASPIELRWPLQSVTSITYTDPTGNPQTLPAPSYAVDKDSDPPRVMPVVGTLWPTTSPLPNNIKIEFVAGFTDPSLVPDNIKSALKLIIGDLYENREQSLIGTRLAVVELPRGVDDLMSKHKQWLVR